MISELTAALIGEWQLNRSVVLHDMHENKTLGNLIGQITFTPDGLGKLLVQEKGILTINQTDNDVYRSYIYELKDDKIYILYNDDHRKGDILHELDFIKNINGEISATHCHICKDDKYTIEFSINSDKTITIDYNVRGPHKNYDMHSVLTAQRKTIIREV